MKFSLSLVFGAAMLMLSACGSDAPKPPATATPPPRTGPQATPPPTGTNPNGNPQANNGGYGQPTNWQNFNGTLIGCDGQYCYYYVDGNYDYCGSYSSCTSGASNSNWSASYWW